MSIADLYRRSRISSRLIEEEIYAEAIRELERGVRRDGLWAKAFAKSGGNEDKTKALYIELRVQSFKDELAIYEMGLRGEKAGGIAPEANSKQDVKNDISPSEKLQERENRIRFTLRKSLGREPTDNEVQNAKWEGMHLDT